MSFKPFTFSIALTGLAAAMALAWWLQRPAPAHAAASAPERPVAPASAVPRAAAAGPVLVEAASVQARTLADDVDAVGSLRSRQGVVVRAEVAGRVVQIGFRDGQTIRKGQLLVQLDDRLPRAQLQQALAEQSIAEANHRRNTDLVARGFISQRGLDESAAAVQVAQAKVELARATVARLRVLAPFDAVAGLRNLSVGDYLREGADVVNLEDMAAMYVDFRLPERLQARVRPGQKAQIQVDALPGRGFVATVQAIDPQIDANGRALAVRACIDNRSMQLRPGMFARVNAELGGPRLALVVPEEAVVSQGGRQSVIRLAPQPGGGEGTPRWLAARVDVRTGERQAGVVEITQGLAAGDQVVTAGQQRIQRDGVPVRIAAAGQGAVPRAAASSPAAAASATRPQVLQIEPARAGNPCLSAPAGVARHAGGA